MRYSEPKQMATGRGRGAAADVEEEDQVDESAAMAAAVEAELAALEAGHTAPEEPTSEVELPARQLPDLSMLQPGEESIPEPAAADPRFDGPLLVPFPDCTADSYH